MADHSLQLGSSTAASNQEILNYDQLAEVFSYLPAKNLCRLHLVSKSLHHMITSDRLFHLTQSYHNAAAAAIIVETCFRLQFFILDPDAGLPPRASLDILSSCRILCSAGGLIFYLIKDTLFYSICAYNPVRRESWLIRIPPDGDIGPRSSLAVEFTNNVAGDYKLVFLTTDEDWSNYRFRVYDSAAQVWTRDEMINNGGRNLKFENPVVHQGAVFWASDCVSWFTTVDPYVLSYEIATGVVEFLAMPELDDGAVEWIDNISVAVWEESWLCLMHCRQRTGTFTAWGRSGDSWVKLNEFVHLEKPKRSVGTRWYATMLVCDGGKEKGMILVFSVNGEAYVYSFRQKDLTRLPTRPGPCFPTFFAYANTLRPACGTTDRRKPIRLLT
ncbi:F-box protein CPR1-like [Curcuma longa]|uniref:F-box protein CPR1-like n=1 Tax=Curcuma longa TaxID=136217 RepID=UPI003D9DC065